MVVAFFLCWAPFHAQRLGYVYFKESHIFRVINEYLMYLSGVTYYVSSTINPILYNLMSARYRDAFRRTLCSLSPGGNGRLLHGNFNESVMVHNQVRQLRRLTVATTGGDVATVANNRNGFNARNNQTVHHHHHDHGNVLQVPNRDRQRSLSCRNTGQNLQMKSDEVSFSELTKVNTVLLPTRRTKERHEDTIPLREMSVVEARIVPRLGGGLAGTGPLDCSAPATTNTGDRDASEAAQHGSQEPPVEGLAACEVEPLIQEEASRPPQANEVTDDVGSGTSGARAGADELETCLEYEVEKFHDVVAKNQPPWSSRKGRKKPIKVNSLA